jgi:hypothetical protein
MKRIVAKVGQQKFGFVVGILSAVGLMFVIGGVFAAVEFIDDSNFDRTFERWFESSVTISWPAIAYKDSLPAWGVAVGLILATYSAAKVMHFVLQCVVVGCTRAMFRRLARMVEQPTQTV